MENTRLNISSDLQKFINKFEPSKFKVMTKGIEIRGINNLHSTIQQAKAIINHLNLKLVVFHSAEMLSYRGFEVNNL
ncbi:hypothetical protein [Pedobacter sp. MW01-1-1]|uniref:hypothetical protein n=1 Tax=Pedobacter sp. MW01-1-1 TaxID=3383027 RepID=UPI003FEFFEFD